MKSIGTEMMYWEGIVEERVADPLKLGRVKVRIIGLHSEKLIPNDKTGDGIPVDALPWAMIGGSTTNANMNGIGESSTGIVEGTCVYGISRDGREFQSLIILGTLPGIPQTGPQDGGFNDPNKVYPRSTHVGESDVNRLARGEKIEETIVQQKRDNALKGIQTSTGASWDEAETKYGTVYPMNKVRETESGHVFEVDDTPGAERISTWHKSGTFDEIHPDGTKVTKIVMDNYTIVLGDNFAYCKGKLNITIAGDANIKVGGDANVQVTGKTIIDCGHIELGKEAIEKLILGDSFMKWFNDTIKKEIDNHTHYGNMGVPTSKPIIPLSSMTASLLSADNTFTL